MKLLHTLLLFPIMAIGQLHLQIGVLDIQDRQDGSTLAWDVGYTQLFERVGIGANLRYSQMLWDTYYTAELNVKYRVVDEEVYRFEVGAGAGYNFDDIDIHPTVTVRNAIRVDEGTWLNFDFDNAYRNSKEGGGRRFETYLMVGIGLDVTRIGQRKLRKIKRFY